MNKKLRFVKVVKYNWKIDNPLIYAGFFWLLAFNIVYLGIGIPTLIVIGITGFFVFFITCLIMIFIERECYFEVQR